MFPIKVIAAPGQFSSILIERAYFFRENSGISNAILFVGGHEICPASDYVHQSS